MEPLCQQCNIASLYANAHYDKKNNTWTKKKKKKWDYKKRHFAVNLREVVILDA